MSPVDAHLGNVLGLGYSGLYSNCKNGLTNLLGWCCKIGVGYAYTLAKSHAEWGLKHSALLSVSAVLRNLTPIRALPSPVGLVQSPCITGRSASGGPLFGTTRRSCRCGQKY